MAEIRDARRADAAAVEAIWTPVVRDTLVTFAADPRPVAEIADLIAARQAAGRAFLVAEAAGRVVGFGTYDQFRGGRGYARTFEHSLYLADGSRGRGIGGRLLSALEAHARNAGGHVLIAAVSGANPRGRNFHLVRGYAEAGILPGVGCKAGRRLDLHLLVKAL